ncbi:MAG: hypothetical protein HRT47_02495 [Candidatus Caenarcaniphilales bacterium]|nr:hypothetical protein [Candidatus Caenarcaniphilales bacterium]
MIETNKVSAMTVAISALSSDISLKTRSIEVQSIKTTAANVGTNLE